MSPTFFFLAAVLCFATPADAGDLAAKAAAVIHWQGRIAGKGLMRTGLLESKSMMRRGKNASATSMQNATGFHEVTDGNKSSEEEIFRLNDREFGAVLCADYFGLVWSMVIMTFIWNRNFDLNGRSVRRGDKTDADAKIGIFSILCAVCCAPIGCCALVWPIDAGGGVGEPVAVAGGAGGKKAAKAEKNAAKNKAKVEALLQPGKAIKIPEKKGGLMGKLGQKKKATIARIEGDTVTVVGKDGVDLEFSRADVLKANKLQEVQPAGGDADPFLQEPPADAAPAAAKATKA